MKFHINDNGEAGRCGAKKDKCPFGKDGANHYDSLAGAVKAFETSQASFRESAPEPTFVDFGDKWQDDPDLTYKKAMKQAKLLKAEGKFVIIATTYAGVNDNALEEPDVEDFDDEDEYEEALEEWEESMESVDNLDDFSRNFTSGSKSHQAFSYESKEAFEREIAANGLPGLGAGEIDGALDSDASGDGFYASRPESGVANNNRAWYFEARVV